MRTVTAFVPYRIKRVSPVRGTDSTIRPPQTRDDRMVKNMKIPFTVDFIINSSTEQFNEFNMNLNEEQRNLCRDIRRRGKNKVWWEELDNNLHVIILLLRLPLRTAGRERWSRSAVWRRSWRCSPGGRSC